MEKEQSGWPGKCSQEQLDALGEFKKSLPEQQLKCFDDAYLLRFLRARKFKVEETLKMWNGFIQWRKANDVDNIHMIKLPEIPRVRECYPHGYHMVDKQFRPIYIERVGNLKLKQMWEATSEERMLKYYTMSYEYLLKYIFPACTEFKRRSLNDPNAPAVDQTLTILDMKNVSLGSASKAYGFVKPIMKIAQDNYPQMLGNMFIINAPFLFSGVWMVLKPFLDDKTTGKIKILGSSYKKELLALVDPDNLPNFLQGGKSERDIARNYGPWNPEGKEVFEQSIAK